MPSNQYGSLYETFVIPDLYNKVWPVAPPNDLNIPAADFLPGFFQNRYNLGGPGTRSIGFSPRDIPTLRKMGVFSNFADGLIFNNTVWNINNGLNVRIDLLAMMAQLSGTITIAGINLTGVGTLFTRELAVGQLIAYQGTDGLLHTTTVATITNDLTATVAVGAAATAGVLAWPLSLQSFQNIQFPVYAMNELFEQSYRIGDVSRVLEVYSGDITVAAASVNMTGRGTRFTSELAASGTQFIRWTDDAGLMRTRQVAAVNSDTSLTLTTAAPSNATNRALIPSFDHLRVQGSIDDPLAFNTISIDPTHATKRLFFGLVAEIEHNLDIIRAV